MWGDSMAVEISRFLPQTLRQQRTTSITTRIYTFPGTSVCGYLELGTIADDARNYRPQVASLHFSGNHFLPCATRAGKGLPESVYAQTNTDDLKTAIQIYLTQDPTIEHVAVVLPPPSIPGPPGSSNEQLIADYKAMVASLADPRVSVAAGPAASVSTPSGAFTWTLPCTALEIAGSVCLGAGSVNTVRSPTGHFCIPESCAGFQPGAWRFANAEANDLLSPFGIQIITTLASGYSS
jgi:hypothetical protein